MNTSRQYGRDDITYDHWYSDWSKLLAKTKTKAEIEKALYGNEKSLKSASKAHLAAIKATTSMQAQSQRRAHSGNVLATCSEYKSALSGALEIHELFPEHAKAQP